VGKSRITGTAVVTGVVALVLAGTMFSSDDGKRSPKPKVTKNDDGVFYTANWGPEEQIGRITYGHNSALKFVSTKPRWQKRESAPRTGDILSIRVQLEGDHPEFMNCWITVNDHVYAGTDTNQQISLSKRVCFVQVVIP
jgi:hypothetical protein